MYTSRIEFKLMEILECKYEQVHKNKISFIVT